VVRVWCDALRVLCLAQTKPASLAAVERRSANTPNPNHNTSFAQRQNAVDIVMIPDIGNWISTPKHKNELGIDTEEDFCAWTVLASP
jgi:hypothetical protein